MALWLIVAHHGFHQIIHSKRSGSRKRLARASAGGGAGDRRGGANTVNDVRLVGKLCFVAQNRFDLPVDELRDVGVVVDECLDPRTE